MKKRKGKTKRWLAGILSAVLVIGSINLVDALEGSNGESALYDAPELTITQGATDYDLMKDITYDSSMYELAVVNDGGFDVNTVGDYEVTYSLTSKDDGTLEREIRGMLPIRIMKTKTRTVETIREGITPRPAITLIMRVLITDPTVPTAAMEETVRMPDREIRILTAAMQETVRMPDREIRILTAAMQKILQMRSAERMQHRVRRIP